MRAHQGHCSKSTTGDRPRVGSSRAAGRLDGDRRPRGGGGVSGEQVLAVAVRISPAGTILAVVDQPHLVDRLPRELRQPWVRTADWPQRVGAGHRDAAPPTSLTGRTISASGAAKTCVGGADGLGGGLVTPGVPDGRAGPERHDRGGGRAPEPWATGGDRLRAALVDRRDERGGSGRTVVDARPGPARAGRGGGRRATARASRARGLAQAGDLVAAVGALGEVPLELGALDVVEGVDGVGAGEGVDGIAHRARLPSCRASRMSPSRMRVLAVPTGRSSMAATSVCV